MRTTIDIDISDYLDDAVDEIVSEIEEAIENIRKYRPDKVSHTEEIDMHDLLEEQRAIGLIWDTAMLLSRYPHLTEEQAWEVLQYCKAGYTAEDGLSWDAIASAVAELHPSAFLMPQRIARCERALEPYDDTDDANLTDLLADLMHWSKRKGQSFEKGAHDRPDAYDHETPTE